MKKNTVEKKEKRIYLPLSVIIIYSMILLVLVLLLVFIAPIAIDYMRDYFYYQILSPDIVVVLFFSLVAVIIVLVSFLLYFNEKIKRRSREHVYEDNELITTHSKIDADRSYLEQQITDLSNKLLSTQKRWEEVNHLIVSSHTKNLDNNGEVSSDSFLHNFNIDLRELAVDKKLVFLLTPFHDDHYNDYTTIKNACAEIGFNTIRGDEELIKGDILSHIIRCIIKSRIVVANINGRNPNVFYELGIAHALNKPTILVSNIDNEIPFDLKTQHVIIYKDEHELAEKTRRLLLQILID